MAKIETIKENHLFSRVYAKGKSAVGMNMVIYALKNYGKEPRTLLGITTSKKLGGAVQRSRARRIIREAYRAAAAECRFSRPFLIVIVARSALFDKKRKTQDLIPEMLSAFRELGLLSEET